MSPSTSLVTALRAERDAFIEEALRFVPERIPFYAAMPVEARIAVAARVVDFVLGALAEDRTDVWQENVRAYGLEVFERRRKQGGKMSDLLAIVRFMRGLFRRRAFRVEASREELERVVDRIEDVFDLLTECAGPVYERNLDEARAAAASLESRYRDLYQRTPAIMHSIDCEGRIEAVSNRWLETLGYTADEVLGRRSVDFLAPESRRRAIEINIPKLRAEGQMFGVEYQFVKKNGELVDARLSSVGLRSDDGQFTNFLAVFDDVTAERRAEREKQEVEERWRSLMEMSPVPLSIHRGGLFVWANAASLRTLGMNHLDDFAGKTVLEIVHPDDQEMVLERIRLGATTKERLPALEERLMRLDGGVVYAEVTAQPCEWEGSPAVLTAIIDVTARRQAEEARRAAEEAQRLGETQAQIIAAQEEALRALSTPLIPMDEGVLVLPVIGRVGPERAERIMQVLADGVVSQAAEVAILDLTGVPEADGFVAEALLRVSRAVELLGAMVVITGVRPGMARTLVEIGADFSHLPVRATLREGIAFARAARRGGAKGAKRSVRAR